MFFCHTICGQDIRHLGYLLSLAHVFNEGATSSASRGEGAVSVTPPVRLDAQGQGGGSTAGQLLPGQAAPPSWRGHCRCTGVAPLQKECRHSADDSPSVRV